MSLPFGAAPTQGSGRAISPSAAIAHALKLLPGNPAVAERQARAVLQALPQDARALFVIGAARRRLRDFATARRILDPLAIVKHESAEAHYELGLTLAESGDREGGVRALRRATALEGDFAAAWLALSEQLYMLGDRNGADAAYDEHNRLAVTSPDLRDALAALRRGETSAGEAKLRLYLSANPQDLGAARLMGETLMKLSRLDEAEVMLAHCVRLAPGFAAARHALALLLYETNRPDEAIAHLETLLAAEPGKPDYLIPLAACHVLRSDYDKAMPLLRRLTNQRPDDAAVWVNYGQSVRIVGDRAAAIAAFRRAIALDPRSGAAYGSLADLKVGALGEAEIAEMQARLDAPELPAAERVGFHYALGKAHEDQGAWETSFRHYAQGARLRHAALADDYSQNAAAVARLKRQFTLPFFAAREGWGCADASPIFIVGLPRSGSTLLEQILSSHSQIEPTMELSFVTRIAARLHERGGEEKAFPNTLEDLPRERFAEFGREYLEAVAGYRKRKTARFIDKMPANFFHVGFIKLMLPNARVIDIRRHPMSAGFSVFKQQFLHGQAYSYDLAAIGAYYREYLSLMTHYERALPGFVHRVHYDEVVDDPEGEVRRLFAYLDLDFEPQCLEFWRNRRPVATHSSEQVRQPIYRDAIDLWRRYEPWLAPLRESLGDALDAWSVRPPFSSTHL